MSKNAKKNSQFDDEIPSEDTGSFDADEEDFGDGGDDDGEEGGMMLSEMLDEDDVVDDNAHDSMLRRLGGLNSGSANKKRKLADLYQNRSENMFELRGRVGVDDLIGALESSSDSKKKLAKLAKSQNRLKIQEALSRPAQERYDREVQYKDSKERLTEWLPTVKAMRIAPQVVFPLPESDPALPRPSNNTLVAKFTPQTDLERQIQDIMEASGVSEEKLAQFEALQEKQLSPEEIRERHAQLAKMRSLFFFQEKKNKRLKKIKSKKYRKILRHAKEKGKLTLDELEELDPEAAKEERARLEKLRAEERMTRKHKTTGKWAKYAAKSHDPRFKDALNEHLRRGQELVRKINDMDGSNSSDDDDDDLSDEDSDDIEQEEQRIRQQLRKDKSIKGAPRATSSGHLIDEDGVLVDPGVAASVKADAIDEDLLVPSVEADTAYPDTGVFAMKFMKRAANKKRSEFNKLVQDMDEEDKDWQKKMEAALREDHIARAEKDDAEDEIDSDMEASDDDDDAAARRQQKRIDAARQKQKAEQRENDKQRKQHVVIGAGGRQKFGMIGSDKGTGASVASSALTAEEKRSMRRLASNAQSLEPGREGFEIGLSGPLEIPVSYSTAGTPSSHMPMDVDEVDDAGTSYNLNKTNVNAKLAQDAARQEQQKQQQQLRAQKDKAAQQAASSSSSSGVKLDTSDRAAKLKTGPAESPAKRQKVTEDNGEGHISLVSPPGSSKKANKAAAAANPWLDAQDDDDDAPVAAAPTGKTSQQKQQLKQQEKEKKSERKKQREAAADDSNAPLRLDLNKIRDTLQNQADADEPAFNLVAAANSSRAQRDLIDRAFAADHLTEEQFEQEKNADAATRNEVDAEMAEMLMPGWGDWAGPSVQPSKRRQRLLQTLEEKKAARQAELLAERKDSKMKRVVINEKKVKKFAKYEAGEVPYPFKTREEYEASLRTPLGKEWNTTTSHRAVIKPNIKVKRGKIIEPLKNKLPV